MLHYWLSRLHVSRQHLSNDDCLEDKREDYRNCSVMCCVPQLCTMMHTHLGSWFRFSFLSIFAFLVDYFVCGRVSFIVI